LWLVKISADDYCHRKPLPQLKTCEWKGLVGNLSPMEYKRLLRVFILMIKESGQPGYFQRCRGVHKTLGSGQRSESSGYLKGSPNGKKISHDIVDIPNKT